MKTTFISDWFDNPYKTLLCKHLHLNHIQVEEIGSDLVFAPQVLLSTPKTQILHLQTIHCFLVSQSWLFSWCKFLLFTVQIIILKLLGIKIIWTVHEWQDKVSARKKKNITPLQRKILGKLINAVITHCDSTKKLISQELSLEKTGKVFVVPHGNYISWYENTISPIQARRALDIAEDKFVFLIFGGIHRGKGILEGISAFKQLPQLKVNLIIAGKNGSIKLTKKIEAEIKNWENISLVSLDEGVPDAQVQTYLNACDCLLLPYKIFTTSGVALLGMSFGKPCIVPNSGFFQDVFQNGGAFLYEPDRIDSLSKTMEQAMKDAKLLSKMGANNLQLAQKWNWNFVAEKTAQVYQWCLTK